MQSVSYELEYGTASLEAHIDAINPGDRILLVDDLIATGGTASASCRLIERLGGEVAACAFVIELDELGRAGKAAGPPGAFAAALLNDCAHTPDQYVPE